MFYAQPIEGAEIAIDTGESTFTDDVGGYNITDVLAGDRQITASAGGFRDQNKTVTVLADDTVNADFALRPKGGGKGKKPNRGAIRRALKAKNRHEKRFLDIEGVVGAGVAISAKGQVVIQFYLAEKSEKINAKIPNELDGVPVEVIVTGEFQAF